MIFVRQQTDVSVLYVFRTDCCRIRCRYCHLEPKRDANCFCEDSQPGNSTSIFIIHNRNSLLITVTLPSSSPRCLSVCRWRRWTYSRVWSFGASRRWWSVVVELLWKTENWMWLKVQDALSPGRLSPTWSTRGSEPVARLLNFLTWWFTTWSTSVPHNQLPNYLKLWQNQHQCH